MNEPTTTNPVYFYDFDGFVWVTSERELAGPYADLDEARADWTDYHLQAR